MSQDTDRRQVSIFGIVTALVFVSIASVGWTGNPSWLIDEGTQWIAAGVLALIGLGLVATTLPGLRKRR